MNVVGIDLGVQDILHLDASSWAGGHEVGGRLRRSGD